MAITRRQFIKRSTVATTGAVLAPSLFANPFVRRAFADTIGDRYLVVVFLDGGNDGLNTVVPYDDPEGLRTAYNGSRRTGSGGLRLDPGQLSVPAVACKNRNATQLGFHPGLSGFTSLYDLGKLAVIQGCGYPDYNLSHEESRVIWQTANPQGVAALSGTGWVGRHLAANYGPSDVKGVTIDSSIAMELRQTATNVLAIGELESFTFPYDRDYDDDDGAKRDAFFDLCVLAQGQPSLSAVGGAGRTTLESTENYQELHNLYTADRSSWSAQYDDIDRSTAFDLREVAKVIYGVSTGAPGANARFFQISNGGYDTHSNQGAAQIDGDHYVLHKELGDSLHLFYQDLADMGVAHKTCVVVYSEFSRRIIQNDNGTDHGSQGPMFVIGGSVVGGVYGNFPDIVTTYNEYLADPDGASGNTEYSQSAGVYRSTDFRDVYGTILKHWLNMPVGNVATPGTILGSVLRPDSGSPASNWTSPNFDLGFLP